MALAFLKRPYLGQYLKPSFVGFYTEFTSLDYKPYNFPKGFSVVTE